MTHTACETKLRSVVTSHMHPCPGNCGAIGRAVVKNAREARSFSAGIKYWYCIYAKVKACLCQGSGIWPKCDVTRRQRPTRNLALFTLQRNLPSICAEHDFWAFTRSQSVQVQTSRFPIHLFLFILARMSSLSTLGFHLKVKLYAMLGGQYSLERWKYVSNSQCERSLKIWFKRTVPTFNSCTKCVSIPAMIHDNTPNCWPSFLGMDVWITQHEHSFDGQALWVIDALGIFVWHVVHGCFNN